MLVLQGAFSKPTIADVNAMWDTDQLHIREFDARTGLLVTVIKQNVEAGSGEFGVELVGCLANRFVLVFHWYQRDLEGCQGVRPENAAIIVVLLDRSGNHPGNADPIAAHGQGDRLAILTHDTAVHGLAVLGAKLEDMSNLDAALDHQRALAVRAWVASHHVAQ